MIVTERPHFCKMTVWHGETWYDPLPQLVDPISGEPFDVTDVTIELFIRPEPDHSTRFVLLTSVADAGIVKEDAEDGLIAIFYSQANVEANLPVYTGRGQGWGHFMRLSFTDADLGAVKKLLWTGPCVVLPARDDPTP